MEVVRQEVTFGQLQLGDVFKSTNYSFNGVYIKTENCFMQTDGRGLKNAVCLNDGHHILMDKDSVIQPINGKFIY